jgi:hypothetical protein
MLDMEVFFMFCLGIMCDNMDVPSAPKGTIPCLNYHGVLN